MIRHSDSLGPIAQWPVRITDAPFGVPSPGDPLLSPYLLVYEIFIRDYPNHLSLYSPGQNIAFSERTSIEWVLYQFYFYFYIFLKLVSNHICYRCKTLQFTF